MKPRLMKISIEVLALYNLYFRQWWCSNELLIMSFRAFKNGYAIWLVFHSPEQGQTNLKPIIRRVFWNFQKYHSNLAFWIDLEMAYVP